MRQIAPCTALPDQPVVGVAYHAAGQTESRAHQLEMKVILSSLFSGEIFKEFKILKVK